MENSNEEKKKNLLKNAPPTADSIINRNGEYP